MAEAAPMERLSYDLAGVVASFIVPKEELRGEVIVPDEARRKALFKRYATLQCADEDLDLMVRVAEREEWAARFRTEAELEAMKALASLSVASRRVAATWGSVAVPFREAVARKQIDVRVDAREAVVLWRLALPRPGEPSERRAALSAALTTDAVLNYALVGRLGLARAEELLRGRRPGPEDSAAASARALKELYAARPRHLVRGKRDRPLETVGAQLEAVRRSYHRHERAVAEAALLAAGRATP